MLLAIAFEGVVFLWPAWKSARIAKSLVVLVRCLKALDKRMATGEIKAGDHLHDKLYSLLHLVVKYKINLKPSALKHISYDPEAKQEGMRLQSEMERLDQGTRDIVNQAMLNFGLILFLRNPVVSVRVCLKIKKINQTGGLGQANPIKGRMAATAALITLKAKDQDYRFAPCRI